MFFSLAPWRLINRNRYRYMDPALGILGIDYRVERSLFVFNFEFLMDTLNLSSYRIVISPGYSFCSFPWRCVS